MWSVSSLMLVVYRNMSTWQKHYIFQPFTCTRFPSCVGISRHKQSLQSRTLLVLFRTWMCLVLEGDKHPTLTLTFQTAECETSDLRRWDTPSRKINDSKYIGTFKMFVHQYYLKSSRLFAEYRRDDRERDASLPGPEPSSLSWCTRCHHPQE